MRLVAALVIGLPGASAQVDVRVATWNMELVGAPGTAQYVAARQVIDRVQPDVLGVQEVENDDEVAPSLPAAADGAMATATAACFPPAWWRWLLLSCLPCAPPTAPAAPHRWRPILTLRPAPCDLSPAVPVAQRQPAARAAIDIRLRSCVNWPPTPATLTCMSQTPSTTGARPTWGCTCSGPRPRLRVLGGSGSACLAAAVLCLLRRWFGEKRNAFLSKYPMTVCRGRHSLCATATLIWGSTSPTPTPRA